MFSYVLETEQGAGSYSNESKPTYQAGVSFVGGQVIGMLAGLTYANAFNTPGYISETEQGAGSYSLETKP